MIYIGDIYQANPE